MASKSTRAASDKADMIETLNKLLDDKLKPINRKLESIEGSLTYALDEITKIAEIENTISDLQSSLKVKTIECNDLKTQNAALKNQILSQESFSRRNNVLIRGMQSTGSLEKDICQILEKTDIHLTPRDFERVHFQGPVLRNQPRPILARFHHYKDKEAVMAKK